MMRTTLRFLIGLSCVLAKFCSAAATLDASPAPSPVERLVELCTAAQTAKNPSPPVDKLTEAYLDLEWQRLSGKTPLPKRDAKDKDSLRKVRVKQSSALKSDELDKLAAWFKEQPAFREKFLLALSPYTDDMAAAARVALALREAFPKDCDALPNMVVAFSVVWDQPNVISSSAIRGVPELYKKPYPVMPYLESFGWYLKHRNEMCPWFSSTPWRLMTNLAVEASPLSEREWILKKTSFSPGIGKVYTTDVKYDYVKLKDDIGKIGSNPYNLENLNKYGGVCRDQAYYARSFCRAFGMPAYSAHGMTNTGVGHAWVGWVVKDAKGYHLVDHGRYSGDKFYTAEIIEPDTGESIYDYIVGIEADGLSDEKAYDQADLMYRVWLEVGPQLPVAARSQLLMDALNKNVHHRLAWLAMGEATAAGELPREMAGKQWDILSKSFQQYPDFIFGMLKRFSAMNKTPDEKYKFYEFAVPIFRKAKREDLVASLRMQQLEMCVAEGRKDLGANVALMATEECAGEGTDGVKLAKQAVALLRELKKETSAIDVLAKALNKNPRQDGIGGVNPNWMAIATLLRDLYKDTGETKKAADLQTKMDHAVPEKKDKARGTAAP